MGYTTNGYGLMHLRRRVKDFMHYGWNVIITGQPWHCFFCRTQTRSLNYNLKHNLEQKIQIEDHLELSILIHLH